MLKDIKHVKGKRVIFNLPLNGQRTHTNSKTVKKYLKKDQYRYLIYYLKFIAKHVKKKTKKFFSI